MSRDDFKAKQKQIIAARAGHHCSNPGCKALTSGPSKSAPEQVNMGVAAHITAASAGGARFDQSLSSEERSNIENGIWLCHRCSVLIDKHAGDYSVEILKGWKDQAETAARAGLEHPGRFALGEANAYTVGCLFRFTSPSKYFEYTKLRAKPGHCFSETMTLKPLNSDEGIDVHDAWIPMLTDASYGPGPNATAFYMTLQNFGTGIEPTASIKLTVDNACFWKQRKWPEDRGSTATTIGGSVRSGVAGISVQNLAPGERLGLCVYSQTRGPFNVSVYCESAPQRTKANIFDVVFGPVQMVKKNPRNEEFEKDQYPYGR